MENTKHKFYFEETVMQVGERMIVRLPQPVSEALPSRGQVAIVGLADGAEIATVIEPDGMKGHWISLNNAHNDAQTDLQSDRLKFKNGKTIAVEFNIAKTWPEPQIPEDFKQKIENTAGIKEHWQNITPMARWEWVRWINETRNPKTRARRIKVAISKMHDGSKRPCCFNLASCTDPELAKSGKLSR